MSDNQYPIGKFTYEGFSDEAQRKENINRIATVGERLVALLKSYKESDFEHTYRDGSWTVRQLIHHLFDAHAMAVVRIKLGLTEENPRIPLYEQAKWADLADSKIPVDVSVSGIVALHKRWSVLLNALSESDFKRTVQHPIRGEMTIDNLVALYAWHGDHHLAHIKIALESK